jgi:hypothetical protein
LRYTKKHYKKSKNFRKFKKVLNTFSICFYPSRVLKSILFLPTFKSSESLTMPSHLRNGKDHSFEQLRAAEQAAKRDAERLRQQQRLAEIASRHSGFEQPSDRLGQYNRFPSVGDPISAGYPSSSVGQSSAANYYGPSGDQPTVGYTFSPAALERLRQTREQQTDAHGSGRDRPA